MPKRIAKAGLAVLIIGSALAAQGGNHVLLGWGLAIAGTFMFIGFDMDTEKPDD